MCFTLYGKSIYGIKFVEGNAFHFFCRCPKIEFLGRKNSRKPYEYSCNERNMQRNSHKWGQRYGFWTCLEIIFEKGVVHLLNKDFVASPLIKNGSLVNSSSSFDTFAEMDLNQADMRHSTRPSRRRDGDPFVANLLSSSLFLADRYFINVTGINFFSIEKIWTTEFYNQLDT